MQAWLQRGRQARGEEADGAVDVHPKLAPFFLGSPARFDIVGVLHEKPQRVVLKARDTTTDRFVAIKRTVHRQFPGRSGPVGKTLVNPNETTEIDFLSQYRHPCIVGFRGFLFTPSSALPPPAQCLDLVFDLCDSSLEDVIVHQRRMRDATNAPDALTVDPVELWGVTVQLTLAVSFLHDFNLLHRDIKPSNVLVVHVPEEWQPTLGRYFVKLTDFETLKVQEPGSEATGTQNRGTQCYRAPELIGAQRPVYTAGTDIWSLGCTLFALMTSRRNGPFGELVQPDGTPIRDIEVTVLAAKQAYGDTFAFTEHDLFARYGVDEALNSFPMIGSLIRGALKCNPDVRARSVKEWVAGASAMTRSAFSDKAALFVDTVVKHNLAAMDSATATLFVTRATALLQF